jgi:hypothetical protein
MKLFEVKNLLTKFYYRNEHLYFQILVQRENSLDVYGEYMDYNEYKTAFDSLQNSFLKVNPMKLAVDSKVKTEEPVFAKVA